MKKKIVITTIFIIAICLIGLKTLDTQADNFEYTYYIENLPSSVERTRNYKVRGWVMSEYEDKEVKIYIDDNEVTVEKEARPDVIEAIKGYGTEEQNKEPGYLGYIDTTKLSIGMHTYKLEILDSNTKQVLATETRAFEVANYKYTSWIERLSEPVEKSTSYKIRGWVMANTANKEVKAYVDNEEVEIEKEERPDVIEAIKGYGTEEQNKEPGYVGYIDTTKLSAGKHEFKLVITDTITGEIIGEVTKEFEVESYKYTYYMEKINTVVERSQNYKIRGWVMANTAEKTVKVYVDDEEVEIETEKRPDVIEAIKGYGTEEQNKEPGYVGYIDTTKLTAGNHVFKIVITDNQSGEVIGEVSKTFEVESYKYTYYMEKINSIVSRDENFLIRGWVMADTPNKTIKAYVDDTEIQITKEARPDVIEAIKGYGGKDCNPEPGYTGYMDTSNLTTGKHKFRLVIIDTINNEVIGEVSKTFEVEGYKYKSWLETPKMDSTTNRNITIKGWVMSPVANKTTQIYIDDTLVGTADKARPDVVEAYGAEFGDETLNPTPGYEITYDATELKDGTHTLTIVTINNNNQEVIKKETSKFNLKKYAGQIYLESFSNSMFTKEIIVRGWKMTEAPDSYVKVYIDTTDMEKLGATITPEERADVIAAHGEQYGVENNKVPGFNINVDLSQVGQGVHTLKFVIYSNKDEEICNYTKQIMVYKGLTLGIDVSQYNGSINWTNVKRDSIDFAFIRLGYRGYGTAGNLALDSQYRTNINNAKAAGINVGVYFFSQAVNYTEGTKEANYVIDNLMSQGLMPKVTLPIVIDTEASTAPNGDGRADGISKADRTAAIKGFTDRIKQRGYTPMIYASPSWLTDNLDLSQLSDVKIWLAHWTHDIDERSNYTGVYEAWQYTNKGSVSGISGAVDRNVSFAMY